MSGAEATKDLIARGFRALGNFSRGVEIKVKDTKISPDATPDPEFADSSNIEFDLPDMFELIGQAAKNQHSVWVLLIDEVQYAPELFSHIKIAIDNGAAPGSFW